VTKDRGQGDSATVPGAATGGAPEDTSSSSRQRRQLPLWLETILLLVLALGLAVLIKAFFVQAFYIPSESMEPGLVRNDRILVEKPSYWGDGSPQRGDVVVFQDPGGWLSEAESAGPSNPLARAMVKVGLYPAGGHLVKRVIGVEGDTVSCCDTEGRISVNGTPLDEQAYVRDDPASPCNGPMIGCDWEAGPVPPGQVFVMGDNRARSADSTVHLCTDAATDCVPGSEFVPTDLVVGKVFVLLWPADRFDWVSRPADFADVPDAS
jgi:signal peptidase I